MIPVKMFGPQLADLTAETVYTVPTNNRVLWDSFTVANAGAATVIRVSIGVDGATTRVIEYAITAGPVTTFIYPRIVLNSGETLQLSSTVTDDVCVCTASGYIEGASLG